MKRVQILRNRGVPISQEEEKLRGRLEELLEQLKNPAHFRGKITELWAQIQILKDSKRLHPSGNYEVSDEAQLEVIGKVLYLSLTIITFNYVLTNASADHPET